MCKSTSVDSVGFVDVFWMFFVGLSLLHSLKCLLIIILNAAYERKYLLTTHCEHSYIKVRTARDSFGKWVQS